MDSLCSTSSTLKFLVRGQYHCLESSGVVSSEINVISAFLHVMTYS